MPLDRQNLAQPWQRICVALDYNDPAAALRMVERLEGKVGFFKVGLELFSAGGPAVVQAITSRGGRVFLDLKLHDIPHTVAQASAAAAGLRVAMFNVHAAGGAEMMRAAAAAVAAGGEPRPAVLAVTLLTSLDDASLNSELLVPGDSASYVVHLARMARDCGLDGVIASPREIAAVRQACGRDFLIVTPGVRPRGARAEDQRRVMTPGEAAAAGADVLVIGRPITASPHPEQALRDILADIS